MSCIEDMAKSQNTVKIIFVTREFTLPSDFMNSKHIHQNILFQLSTNKKYAVKSMVSEHVFQSFVDYLISKKIPIFHPDDIFEYEKLSLEFDCMTEIIQMYRKYQTKIHNSSEISKSEILKEDQEELQNLFRAKSATKTKITRNYRQIISKIFNKIGKIAYSRFLKLKTELLNACIKDEVESVDMLLMQKVTKRGLIFGLNEDEGTACVLKDNSSKSDVFIPRSIKHESHEYLITSIYDFAFHSNKTTKTIKCAKDSEIRSIGKNAFKKSLIENISIPSTVTEFKKGWCKETNNLNQFTIFQRNESNIMNYENDFILGKIDNEGEEFDVLLFARRDINIVCIPDFIKHISSYAFYNCKKISKVNISSNSKLQIIDKNSFRGSSIKQIYIPSHVCTINYKAFFFCENLQHVEIEENSELRKIGNNAFRCTSISFIKIPSHVTIIDESAFLWCTKLQQIEFEHNSELRTIGKYAFDRTDPFSISIPSSVYKICESAFYDCGHLNSVEFPTNSKLRIIGESAFNFTAVENIVIPSHVTEIGPLAFNCCYFLKSIEFGANSELKTFGKFCLSASSIRKISIPSTVIDFRKGWCSKTYNLNKFSIIQGDKANIMNYKNNFILGKSDEKSDEYDVLLFARRNIRVVQIPDFVKHIYPFAFDNCQKITKIQISETSKLRIIDQCAFSFCEKLRRFDIHEKSELKSIGKYAFWCSAIKSVFIPAKVSEIHDQAFYDCRNLEMIELSENLENDSVDMNTFKLIKDANILIPLKIKSNFI